MTKRSKSNKGLQLSRETVRRMGAVRRVADEVLKEVAGGPANRPSINNNCLTLDPKI